MSFLSGNYHTISNKTIVEGSDKPSKAFCNIVIDAEPKEM